MWHYLLYLIEFQWKYVNNIYECIPRYLRTYRHSHFPLTSETISVVVSTNYHLRMIKEIYVSFLLLFQQKYLDEKYIMLEAKLWSEFKYYPFTQQKDSKLKYLTSCQLMTWTQAWRHTNSLQFFCSCYDSVNLLVLEKKEDTGFV